MSMPISSVGVATSTLGALGSSDASLNEFSSTIRSSSLSRLVCSLATITRISLDEYSLR